MAVKGSGRARQLATSRRTRSSDRYDIENSMFRAINAGYAWQLRNWIHSLTALGVIGSTLVGILWLTLAIAGYLTGNATFEEVCHIWPWELFMVCSWVVRVYTMILIPSTERY